MDDDRMTVLWNKGKGGMDTETFYHIIPPERISIYRFYQCIFQDGIPMKRMKNGKLVFHPLYPSYCIQELVNLYKNRKKIEYVYMAYDIFLKSNRFLQSFYDSLVFMYQPKDELVNIGYPFYSALTQAQYLYSGGLVYRILQDEDMLYILEGIYRSFKIPQREGGVLLKFDFGYIVEEYHSNPPLLTLNGFMTTIERLFSMHDVISCFDKDVDCFFSQLINGLKYILPFYDCETVCNSRYNLSGFRRMKIIFHQKGNQLKLREAKMIIPKLGIYDVLLEKSKRRFDNYLEKEEKNFLQFNLVMSLFGYPEKNAFECIFYSAYNCSYDVYLSDGDYNPLLTAMPTSRWLKIHSGEVQAGENQIHIPLPFDKNNFFAYPTNFKKVIGGIHYNAYHFLHIKDLVLLYNFTKEQLLLEYATKFYKYTKKWHDMEIYCNSTGGGHVLAWKPIRATLLRDLENTLQNATSSP